MILGQPQIDRSPVYLKAAAEKGKDAILRCMADGVPEVEFYWSKGTDDGVKHLYSNQENVVITSHALSQTRYEVSVCITYSMPSLLYSESCLLRVFCD